MNQKDKRFHNIRIRKETFDELAEWAYEHDHSLARCIEDALGEWMDKNLGPDTDREVAA